MSRFSDLYTGALWQFYQDTSDEVASTRFTALQRDFRPQVEQLEQDLTQKAVRHGTSDPELKIMLDAQQLEMSVQHPENAPLKTTLGSLSNRFNTLVSKQTVTLEKVVTLSEVRTRIQNEGDGTVREELWSSLQIRKAQDSEEVDALFLEAFAARKQIALNVGLPSYREVSWRSKKRTDYSPDDTLRWLDAIAEVFEDTQRRHAERSAARLKVKRLHPWDLEVTQTKRPSVRRFAEADYLNALWLAYDSISPGFGEIVSTMTKRHHIDLMGRPNKVTTNFSTLLTTHNEPLVSCNASGDVNDLRVQLHECGHAVHLGLSGRGKHFFNKIAPHEICELMAYTLQMIGGEALLKTGVLEEVEVTYFRHFVLDALLRIFQTYDRVERFQHWLYQASTPLSVEELDDAWLQLHPDPLVDWRGYEFVRKKGWHHAHIMNFPFYSIEYVIAWIGTLLFLERYRREPSTMVSKLQQSLHFGNTRGVAQTLAALDIPFPFRKRDIVEAHHSLLHEFAEELV